MVVFFSSPVVRRRSVLHLTLNSASLTALSPLRHQNVASHWIGLPELFSALESPLSFSVDADCTRSEWHQRTASCPTRSAAFGKALYPIDSPLISALLRPGTLSNLHLSALLTPFPSSLPCLLTPPPSGPLCPASASFCCRPCGGCCCRPGAPCMAPGCSHTPGRCGGTPGPLWDTKT